MEPAAHRSPERRHPHCCTAYLVAGTTTLGVVGIDRPDSASRSGPFDQIRSGALPSVPRGRPFCAMPTSHRTCRPTRRGHGRHCSVAFRVEHHHSAFQRSGQAPGRAPHAVRARFHPPTRHAPRRVTTRTPSLACCATRFSRGARHGAARRTPYLACPSPYRTSDAARHPMPPRQARQVGRDGTGVVQRVGGADAAGDAAAGARRARQAGAVHHIAAGTARTRRMRPAHRMGPASGTTAVPSR